jgi:peptidoglycan/LPS O-acetylase OafA/YrhL
MNAAHGNNGTLVRYVAAMFVVVQHAYLLAGEPDPVFGTGHFRHIGNIGVLMFFALSGYLLTTRAKVDPLPYFVASRLFRIYPLLIAVNVLTILLGGYYTTLALHQYYGPDTFSFVWNNLISFGQETLPGVSIGPVTESGFNQRMNIAQWSIFYELRAYAILSLLALMGIAQSRAALNVVILLVVLAQPFTDSWLHFGDRRAAEVTAMFFFGAFFAINPIKLDWKLIVLGIVMIAASDLYRSQFSSMLFSFGVAAVTVTLSFGLVPYLKLIDRLPDLTYPLFLAHWPIALVITDFVTLPAWQLSLAITGATLLVSIPLHYLIEEPTRQIPKAFRKWRRRREPDALPQQA